MIKKIYCFALTALFLGSVFTSCEMKDELVGGKKVPTETGYVELGLGLKEEQPARATNDKIVSSFPVIITNKDPELSSTNHSFDSFGTMTNPLMLPVGSYTVEAHSPEDFENVMDTPYYKGTSDLTITKGITSDVQVVCKMLNTKIQMIYSDEFKAEFKSWNITFDDGKSNTLTFSSSTPDKTSSYWYLGETGVATLRMNITAVTVDDVTVTDTKSFTKTDAGVSYDDDNDNFVGGDQLFITLNPDGGSASEPEKPEIGFDVKFEIAFTESGESGTVEIPVDGTVEDDDNGDNPGPITPPGSDIEGPTLSIPSDVTYSLSEGNIPNNTDVVISAPKCFKSILVTIIPGNEAFEATLADLGSLTFLDGQEMVNNEDIKLLFNGLGVSGVQVPTQEDTEYTFPVSAFFTFLNITGPTDEGKAHQFKIDVTDMDNHTNSGILSVYIKE